MVRNGNGVVEVHVPVRINRRFGYSGNFTSLNERQIVALNSMYMLISGFLLFVLQLTVVLIPSNRNPIHAHLPAFLSAVGTIAVSILCLMNLKRYRRLISERQERILGVLISLSCFSLIVINCFLMDKTGEKTSIANTICLSMEIVISSGIAFLAIPIIFPIKKCQNRCRSLEQPSLNQQNPQTENIEVILDVPPKYEELFPQG